MKKIAIIILLISMLAGCGKKQISMDFSEEERVETSVAEGTAGDTIYVYISGQVKKPGVYQVQKDARMFEVIQKAGGFTKKAESDYLNQAEPVSDGQAIHVLSKKEYRASEKKQQDGSDVSGTGDGSGAVNINSATEQELTTLPGIGTTKAKAIIEYRETNGRFTKKEDLKNVSGIGDGTYSKLESMIAVD